MSHNQGYTQEAIRTEAPITKEVKDRLESSAGYSALMMLFRKSSAVGEQLNELKRFAFYAKGTPPPASVQAGPVPKLSDRDARLIHAAVGLITESVEFLQGVIAEIHGVENTHVNLIEELGDIGWYRAVASDALQVSQGSIDDVNIEKLRLRFPKAFSEENAVNRDTQAEADTMKKGLAKEA